MREPARRSDVVTRPSVARWLVPATAWLAAATVIVWAASADSGPTLSLLESVTRRRTVTAPARG
jgi:hypothetical protein